VQPVVTHFLAEMLSRGVADAGVLRSEPSAEVSLRRAEAERVVPRDSILSFADLMERAEAAASAIESPAGQRAVRRLVGAFYHPTVVPDLALTSARREQLRASVDPVKYYVSAGERITTPGQPVTEVGRAKLAALQVQIGKRGSGHPFLRGGAGALLYNAVVMAAFWLLLLFYRRETYDKLREVVFFGVLFSLVLLLTAGLHRAFPGRPELVPIPFAAIVVTLLYNGRVGVVAALTLAILLDGQWALRGTSILFFGLVSGVAGAVGIRAVRRRRHL
jgi:membrane-associated HD superfamily phosphohydrolase